MLQGHPRPWPVAKPRTLRVPARKVQLRIGVVLMRGWYPARSVCAGSGNLPPPALPLWTKKLSTSAALPWATSLSSLPCWVVPPAKASSPAGRASSLLLSPLQGTASPCYTWPLFLHTSAGVNPARSVPGVQDAAVRVAAGCWRSVCPLRYAPGHTLRRWEPAQTLRRRASIRGAVLVRGEGCAPLGRWCALTLLGRSPAQAPEAVCLPTTSVSSAAPGSLRSPFCGAPEPAVLPRDSADRLRGHAPLAALVPRPWSLGDSLPACATPPHRILPATRLPATKANLETHARAAVQKGGGVPRSGDGERG